MAAKTKRKTNRRRRRKRKSTTYESRETKAFFGLIFSLIGVGIILSLFFDSNPDNFFGQARVLFGQSTLFIGIIFFSLGLNMFGLKLPSNNRVSMVAQLLLVAFIPAFLTSLEPTKQAAYLAGELGHAGGRLGYFFAYELFADTLLFAQFTPAVLFFLIAIATPLALSMSLAELLNNISKLITYFGKSINNLFFGSTNLKPSNNVKQKEEIKDDNDKSSIAKRFGDFNRNSVWREKPKKEESQEEKSIENKVGGPQVDLETLSQETNVQITEIEIGEEGLSQEELAYPDWQLPPISLLSPYEKKQEKDPDTDHNADVIIRTLASFNIDVEIVDALVGPSVTQYALSVPLGTNVKKIESLSPTLALGLAVDANAIRVDNIPGTTYLGIEVPKRNRSSVQIRELVESLSGSKKSNLGVTVGKDISGQTIIEDIQKMPHLLIAGATGSGKSILTNSFIISLLMRLSPDQLRMILVDPKQVELNDYNGIPHLLTPVITDMSKVVNALKWAVNEMEGRYTILKNAKVRNIEEYNEAKGFAAMPYIVVVIDEMADMMMTANKVDAENAIVRLTQKARAVGIHLILATQRPSVQVITGIIKANVPARIGMSVASSVDSRVILDANGAEALMGRGDLLYSAPGKKPNRLQGAYVSQEEVQRVVNFIKSQVPEVNYMTSILKDTSADSSDDSGFDDLSDDDHFLNAIRVVVKYQRGSASFLQRRLSVGFNRAARLLEELEEAGVVGPPQGSKPRDVLISDAEEFIQNLTNKE